MVYIPRKQTEEQKQRLIKAEKVWNELTKEPLVYEWEVLVNPDPLR